jgi:hypothetical protein
MIEQSLVSDRHLVVTDLGDWSYNSHCDALFGQLNFWRKWNSIYLENSFNLVSLSSSSPSLTQRPEKSLQHKPDFSNEFDAPFSHNDPARLIRASC